MSAGHVIGNVSSCFTNHNPTVHVPVAGDFPLFDTPGGVLEFDFTSTDRPKRYARKMRRKYVTCRGGGRCPVTSASLTRTLVCRLYTDLGKKLKAGLAKLTVRKPTPDESDPQWIPPVVEANEEMHEDSPEALELYPPLMCDACCAELPRFNTHSGAVVWLCVSSVLDPESQNIMEEMHAMLRLGVGTKNLATDQGLSVRRDHRSPLVVATCSYSHPTPTGSIALSLVCSSCGCSRLTSPERALRRACACSGGFYGWLKAWRSCVTWCPAWSETRCSSASAG